MRIAGMKITMASVFVAALIPAPAHAQPAWPTKEVRLLIGNSAGSVPDIVARTFAAGMDRALGQPMIVENRPGADGTISAALLAKAAADGYTLGFLSQQTVAVAPATRKSMPFDTFKDFTPIAMIIGSTTGSVLAVHESVPVKSFNELIAHAKANPGKLTYSTTVATASLLMEWLKRRAGIAMREVRYSSAPMAQQDALAGRVSMQVNSPLAMAQGVKSGTLRPLVVAGEERLELWPEVPAITEFYSDFGMTSFIALLGPAGMPKDLVGRINRASDAVVRSGPFQDMLRKITWSNKEGARTPEATLAVIRASYDAYKEVVTAIGLAPK